MTTESFPPLTLTRWRATRDTLHGYTQLLGKVRAALTPRQKHWSHITLHATAEGLTTTPIPADGMTFELLLDCARHQLCVATSRGERWATPLRGQPPAALWGDILEALQLIGVRIDLDFSPPDGGGDYDRSAVENFWRALSRIDVVFKEFKGELREETGPVQLFPHHLDLALLWFSGNRVAGVDPNDEENADEQMNFGFATGDEGIDDAYFYITAYPRPKGLGDAPLPAPAYWQDGGFGGAVLLYDALRSAADPHQSLLAFLRAGQQAGAEQMRRAQP